MLMTPITRRSFSLLVAGAMLLTGSSTVVAQAWPTRPITLVVPFPADGTTDTIARLVGAEMAKGLGQPVIIENRPGANGNIGWAGVAKAAPDGYTLFVAALPVMAVVPAINKVRFDPQKDFAPISNIASNPFALVVNKDLPVNTVQEFVDYSRARKGQLSYGSAGVGSLNHLSMALFLKQAGLEMTHVPYKGNAPALSDVVAGHVPAMFSNLSDALPQAKAGNVRMLAVSGETRSPLAPAVPTVAESGYPRYNVLTWNGLMAPARTPDDIIDRIAKELAAAVKDQKFSSQLAGYGVDPIGNTPAEFKAQLARDVATWTEAVEVAGVKEP